MIDTASDGLDNIDVLGRECTSSSSNKRKHYDRVIGGLKPQKRKKLGVRYDMIIREGRCGHDEYIEYGASEAGSLYEGVGESRRPEEGSKKLPQCLKDMLNCLLFKKNDPSNMQTVGFIHSGLESSDRPVKHVTTITKSKSVHISNDVSNFGLTVLPAFYSAWVVKEIVRHVQASL